MKNRLSNDGGYYAIKGFEFQIDKTLLELLNADVLDNNPIKIEQIQDINSDNFVMQVKYKETQEFTPSKIKDPIIQLIQEFGTNLESNNLKIYYLYCYFLNQKEEIKNINLEYLDKILGNRAENFDGETKKHFLEKFILVFAPEFQKQFDSVIDKIKDIFCCSADEAIFYYSNMVNQLRKIVIENANVNNRICTKKDLVENIKQGRNLIFSSAFKDYKGERKYYEFVKSKFIRIQNDQDNFVFFGDISVDSSVSIHKLILDIINNYYKNATHNIKPPTFIISDTEISKIKKCLIDENTWFNDGYEHIQFNDELFFEEPIVNKKTMSNGKATESLEKISFKLRIVSNSKFISIKNPKNPGMIYYFDCEPLDRFSSVSFLKIDRLNTKQIKELFVPKQR